MAFSCERARTAADDAGWAEDLILDSIRAAAERSGLTGKSLPPDPWPEATPGSRLATSLSAWARRAPKRLVLLFDEIDALAGQSLISVLPC